MKNISSYELNFAPDEIMERFDSLPRVEEKSEEELNGQELPTIKILDIEEYLKSNPKKPFINCEYMHSMGNSLGGMSLYTDLEDKYEKYQINTGIERFYPAESSNGYRNQPKHHFQI